VFYVKKKEEKKKKKRQQRSHQQTTKKPSTDNKEAIDSHQVTTGQKQPQTTTLMSACVCVDVCL